jgi:hypothetical protein
MLAMKPTDLTTKTSSEMAATATVHDNGAAIRKAEEDLSACDEPIQVKRAALAKAREAFAPTVAAAIDAPMRDVIAEMNAQLSEVEALVEALAEGRRFFECNGLEPPRLLVASHMLCDAVADIRRAVGIRQ